MSFWDFASGSPCVAGLIVFCVYLAVDSVAGHLADVAKTRALARLPEPEPEDEDEPEDEEPRALARREERLRSRRDRG